MHVEGAERTENNTRVSPIITLLDTQRIALHLITTRHELSLLIFVYEYVEEYSSGVRTASITLTDSG